ncbi:MAG: Na/Pi symporter [Pseudomonadota bacterium]|nr:Na/Pi symporter [Pseudomonadota bacterium]
MSSTLVGALFTALVQSSSATTAIVITMADQGLITLEAGIALAFGANIGTCITALLASLGKPREALRAATVHVVFNVGGVIIWLPFISILASWVTAFSPSSPELEGTARLTAEVPRQIANAHTLFIIVNTLLFIGFTTQLGRFVQWLIPDKVEKETVIIQPVFLSEGPLGTPVLALQNVRLEIARTGDIVTEMFLCLRQAFLERDRKKLAEVRTMDDQVDVLEGDILRYLGALRIQELSEDESTELALSMKAADLFESVGDVIETELVDLGYRALEDGIETSETMRHLLRNLADKLSKSPGVGHKGSTRARSEGSRGGVNDEGGH